MKYILILAVALIVSGGTVLMSFEYRADNHAATSGYPAGEELAERTVVAFFKQNGTVSYAYLGHEVPRKIVADEVEELRTESSYTRQLETFMKDGKEMGRFETIIYPQPAYTKDEIGEWRLIEYATTTEALWDARRTTFAQRVREFFVSTAYAVDYYSGSGDGRSTYSYFVGASGCSMTDAWDTAHDAVTGTNTSAVGTSEQVRSYRKYQNEPNPDPDTCSVDFDRIFLPFDTSSIPALGTISAASLSVYVTSVANQENDGNDYITVATSTQATHTTVANADYDQAGPVNMNAASEVIDSGQRKDITSISTSAYLTFTLNSNGINAIKKSGVASTCSGTAGITCLALREGHDAADDPLTGVTSTDSGVFISLSEQTGTSQDPYLSVTYTAPSSFAFWMFQDF